MPLLTIRQIDYLAPLLYCYGKSYLVNLLCPAINLHAGGALCLPTSAPKSGILLPAVSHPAEQVKFIIFKFKRLRK
jgi:hypothetical protein